MACKVCAAQQGQQTISIGYLLVAITGTLGVWQCSAGVPARLLCRAQVSGAHVHMCAFFALIQIMGCYQIYCRPTYEVVEEWAMDTKQSPTSPRNMIRRFVVTTVYCSLLTLLGCALPFFGSFLALCGAIGFTPLGFILPLLLYSKVHGSSIGLLRRWLHHVLVVFYTLVGIVAAIGAVYFIVLSWQTFSVFADLPAAI